MKLSLTLGVLASGRRWVVVPFAEMGAAESLAYMSANEAINVKAIQILLFSHNTMDIYLG